MVPRFQSRVSWMARQCPERLPNEGSQKELTINENWFYFARNSHQRETGWQPWWAEPTHQETSRLFRQRQTCHYRPRPSSTSPSAPASRAPSDCSAPRQLTKIETWRAEDEINGRRMRRGASHKLERSNMPDISEFRAYMAIVRMLVIAPFKILSQVEL